MRGPYQTNFTIPASSTAPISLSGFGHVPQVLLAFYSGRTEAVDTVGNATAINGFGAATGVSNQICGYRRLAHASSASSNIQSNLTQGVFVGAISGGGRLSLGSVDADGVTFRISVAFTTSIRVTLLSLGKDQVTAKSLQLITGLTTPGDLSITGVGFQPKAGLLFGVGGTPDASGHSDLHFGIASGENGAISQIAMATHSRGNGASADCSRWIRRDYMLGVPSKAPNANALTDRAALSAWTADGATLTYEIAQGFSGAYQFAFLALDGPGFDVGSFQAGNQETTGLEYVPLGALLFSTGVQEGTDATVCETQDHLSIGAAVLNPTALVQECQAVRSEDGAVPQIVTTALDVDSAVVRLTASATKAGEIRVASMGNDGLRLQAVEQASLAHRVAYLAFGYPAPAITYKRIIAVPKEPLASPLRTFLKDSDAVLDFGIDWTRALQNSNGVLDDSIIESSWTVSDPAIEVSMVPAAYHTSTLSAVWLQAGTSGVDYTVTGQIKTAKGRIDERSFVVSVIDH